MRLLLTGFEPFGGGAVNSSEQVVRRLAIAPPEGVDLRTAILPVDRQRGPQILLQAVREASPQAVLCLGQASGKSALTIERVALNLMDYPIPDNQGHQVTDEPVRPGGPAAYFVTLPVRKLFEAVQAVQVPVELSLSAGSYLCNQVLYALLDYLACQSVSIPAGFIHLPRLPEQARQRKSSSPSLSLEASLAGVQAAIHALKTATSLTALHSEVQWEPEERSEGEFTIRRASLQDLETLIEMRLALHREAGAIFDTVQEAQIAKANRAFLQKELSQDDFLCWVVEAEGQTVACGVLILYRRLPSSHTLSTVEGYLTNMYTRPEFRRKGIATALLNEITQYARQAGARRIWLRTTPAGRSVYQKFGFQPFENVMEYRLT